MEYEPVTPEKREKTNCRNFVRFCDDPDLCVARHHQDREEAITESGSEFKIER